MSGCCFFFLAPFFIVFRISLSTTAIAMPPYEPAFSLADGWAGILDKMATFSFDNYSYLIDDPLYFNAYISSVVIAGVSTFLTLLIAYPIAYGMAQAPRSIRPTLLMLVILPFWTELPDPRLRLDRILKPEGLLNQLLLSLHVIDQPLIILNTNTAVYIGIVYSYLPFMVLPLYSSLEKMDGTLIEAAQDLGCPPITGLLARHLPAVAARRRRRLHAGLHPGRRRVRHSRPARRIADADDRQDAVERVLLQPRLAGLLGRGDHPAADPGDADRLLPECAGQSRRSRGNEPC
jgi:ABC-type spermidine/putrescine transport system permease subunit I